MQKPFENIDFFPEEKYIYFLYAYLKRIIKKEKENLFCTRIRFTRFLTVTLF